jgi:basic amino acid/polyamine antiporter, APA family
MSAPGGRSRVVLRQSIGSPVLFTIVYASLAAAVYYSLGVVAAHALGLTPLVFLVAAGLFGLNAMTYLEGASTHQERGGSTVFARYAFNELVSFVAGWAILLDDVILIAVTTFSATQYLRVFWRPLGNHLEAMLLAFVFIALVVFNNIRGFAGRGVRTIGMLAIGDVVLQLLVVVIGLILFFNPRTLLDPIHLGSQPTWPNVIFALTVTTIALTSVESAAGLAGEVRASRSALRRLVASGTMLVLIVYVGIAIVAVTALPVHNGHTALGGRYRDAPVIGIVQQFHPHWLSQTLTYLVGAMATVTLVVAANAAMLGLSRLAYSLSTNRQIPSGLGRLHPVRATPYVLIIIAGVIAAGLVVSENLDLLVGLYAFGAMLAFTIANASVCRLRYSEPDRDRPYRIPLSIPVRGGELPLPAALGTLIFGAGWLAVMVVHAPARYAGLGWLIFGLLMYVIYRTQDENSLLRRVTVAPQMLSAERPIEQDYGSILVPLFGSKLDEDIIQTAALLAAGEPTDDAAIDSSTIEALWIFEIPMSLPLDARLPEAQIKHARQALARAKAVGEEYTGVQIATATVRARRAGQAIVEEARRRGVEAIVLGAEEPSKVRGGRRLGGLGGPLENFVGEVTKYVIAKADCRVIMTASPAKDSIEAAAPGERPSNGEPSVSVK